MPPPTASLLGGHPRLDSPGGLGHLGLPHPAAAHQQEFLQGQVPPPPSTIGLSARVGPPENPVTVNSEASALRRVEARAATSELGHSVSARTPQLVKPRPNNWLQPTFSSFVHLKKHKAALAAASVQKQHLHCSHIYHNWKLFPLTAVAVPASGEHNAGVPGPCLAAGHQDQCQREGGNEQGQWARWAERQLEEKVEGNSRRRRRGRKNQLFIRREQRPYEIRLRRRRVAPMLVRQDGGYSGSQLCAEGLEEVKLSRRESFLPRMTRVLRIGPNLQKCRQAGMGERLRCGEMWRLRATLFNIHWVCQKCGFVVCLDCYKAKEKELQRTSSQNYQPPMESHRFSRMLLNHSNKLSLRNQQSVSRHFPLAVEATDSYCGSKDHIARTTEAVQRLLEARTAVLVSGIHKRLNASLAELTLSNQGFQTIKETSSTFARTGCVQLSGIKGSGMDLRTSPARSGATTLLIPYGVAASPGPGLWDYEPHVLEVSQASCLTLVYVGVAKVVPAVKRVNYENKLQVKNILYHCVKEAVSALKRSSSEEDDEEENS
ncbi:probable JmjC domain-containing histone demethylation protein 2C isoform X1 [Lates japonicus]|uniref:Probable JmjC domain-containing histone demethylation protein 2C isoform X1 n=1 Tax=Lates japonicus TaxID=270547 RepID=A0AAD3N3E2_LATJO|nr:probable JmjC domain-containing histone demethylation protein 2C isoform X1 [Lates japonicus]